MSLDSWADPNEMANVPLRGYTWETLCEVRAGMGLQAKGTMVTPKA